MVNPGGGIPSIPYSGLCWRILAPKWAFDPSSGAGAARFGGRWNRQGVPALYLSEEIQTAFEEYQQDLLVRPGTFCAYRLNLSGVVDLCDPQVQSSAQVSPSVIFCAWKQILLVQKQIPPTWDAADRLIQLGFAGLRVPSAQRQGGVNLVVWQWNDIATRTVEVLDPRQDIPRDQSSWS